MSSNCSFYPVSSHSDPFSILRSEYQCFKLPSSGIVEVLVTKRRLPGLCLDILSLWVWVEAQESVFITWALN